MNARFVPNRTTYAKSTFAQLLSGDPRSFRQPTLTPQLTPTASFTKDLGLDSLDTVEVVMAVEEEFAIEIPDQEADAINAVNDGE